MNQKTNISHPKSCTACGRPITWAKIAYHKDTLKAYCNHSYGCDLEKRPHADQLITDLDPKKLAYSTPFPTDVQKSLEYMIPKAHSFRLAPEQLLFLMQFALENGCTNVNQTIQALVQKEMNNTETPIKLDKSPYERKTNNKKITTKKDLRDEELEYYKAAVTEKVEKYTPPNQKQKEVKKNVAFRL